MYVLLFPHGEPGWGPGMYLNNPDGGEDDGDEDDEAHKVGYFSPLILTVTNKTIDLFSSRF